MLQAVAFYVLAAVIVAAALAVIFARNPVHSVLWLITCFFSAAGLFVLLGAEFLAMILLIVYVGAVAVLFLFVVMMLGVDFSSLRQGFARYLPMGALVAVILTVEMGFVAAGIATSGAAAGSSGPAAAGGGATNAEAIGAVLYTDYIYVFQAAGMILLVAMIGAIVLTLKHRAGVRRQDVSAQMARTAQAGMRLVSIRSGEGLDA